MKIRTWTAFALVCTVCVSGCKPRVAETTVQPATTGIAAPTGSAMAPAQAKPVGFNLTTVPLTHVDLPSFPFLDWPRDLLASEYRSEPSDFSQTWVLAGDQMRSIEGRTEKRTFYNSDAKLSALASRRNYAAAVKALGGVKVNTIEPDDPALVNANGETFAIDKLGMIEPQLTYDAYLVRAPGRNIWITVLVNDARTHLMMVEESAMEQKVALVRADAMRSALDRSGRIALYINFDTGKASLRPDATPTLDQISALLKNDPALKLSIEGHTDHSGDAQHNQVLSQQRADAVVASLVASGIDKARLSGAGLGSRKPLADNAGEEGRAKNRRIELVKVAAR